MKLFFDTEFTGLHKDTTLISLGIISEDGKCFYATLTDYDESQVDDWCQENVIDNLEISKTLSSLFEIYEVTGTKEEVKDALLYWIGSLDDTRFEMVSDVCHYDMVLLVDLFGTAFDFPEFISPCCYDINQDIYYMKGSMDKAFEINREELLEELAVEAADCNYYAPLSIDPIESDDDEYYTMIDLLSMGEDCKHNALWDAIVIRGLFELLNPPYDMH